MLQAQSRPEGAPPQPPPHRGRLLSGPHAGEAEVPWVPQPLASQTVSLPLPRSPPSLSARKAKVRLFVITSNFWSPVAVTREMQATEIKRLE